MKEICAFDELEISLRPILVQTKTVLLNSKVFLKDSASCICLLMFSFYLNVHLNKSSKSSMNTFSSEEIYLTNSVMSLSENLTTLFKSINQFINIVGPLYLHKKGSYESTITSQSLSKSKPLSQKQLVRFLSIFHIKFWFLANEKGKQPEKKLLLQKIHEISLKLGFFGVSEKLLPLMCYFQVYVMYHSYFYDSAKTTCLVFKL